MPTPRARLLIFAALYLLTLSACNRPAAPTTPAQTGADLVYTAAAQTVEAQLTQAASGGEATATPVPPIQEETPAPTAPPISTPAPTEPPEPTPGGTEIPCDRAGFVEDVTIPDGTTMLPGATFKKTWRLQNTGSCTWDSNYSLIFVNGDAMGGPAAAPLTTGTVAPGQEVDITVELTAPTEPGTYRGNWRLRNGAGENFGIGPNADKLFWVEIEVGSPTETPAVEFNLTYETIHDCGGQPTIMLRFENTGNTRVDSAELTLTNLDNTVILYGPQAENEPFIADPGGCPPDGDTVRPGRTRYLGASLASLPPSGTNVRATAKVCTEEDLGGTCVEKSVDFSIP